MTEVVAKDRSEYQKAYHKKNYAKRKEEKRLYYLANKAKMDERGKKWNEDNPDKLKAIRRKTDLKRNLSDKLKRFADKCQAEHDKGNIIWTNPQMQ